MVVRNIDRGSASRPGGTYDPKKPFNAKTLELIGFTHPTDGSLSVVRRGKRNAIDRGDHWEYPFGDGIGTKGLIHWMMRNSLGSETLHFSKKENSALHIRVPRSLLYAAADATAMVANDSAERGVIGSRRPLLHDHILIQEEDRAAIGQIVASLAHFSVENSFIITGGETAIMNTVQGFEVCMSLTSYVGKRDEVLQFARPGDVLLGLGSNGVHSNGYSGVRKGLAANGMTLEDRLPWGRSVGEEFTRPTHIYLNAIKELVTRVKNAGKRPGEVYHGGVNVTGGGYSKLTELWLDNPDRDVLIRVARDHKLERQPVFQWIMETFGFSSERMLESYNNNVGFITAIDGKHWPAALEILRKHFPAEVVGHVHKGDGVVEVESPFDSLVKAYR